MRLKKLSIYLMLIGTWRVQCSRFSGHRSLFFHNLLQLMGPEIGHPDGGHQKHDLAGQGYKKFCIFRIESINHGGDMPTRYTDSKDYLYCFHGLVVQFAFCLPGKPLGITKKSHPGT